MGLDLADAPLVEPASVSWHALRLAGTGPGTRVAIVGAGALGLLAVPGARRLGAPEVALEARHDHQPARERLGARVGASGRYDVVVEAAGSKESLAQAVDLVAPGGAIVVLGVHLGPVELNWMPLFNREARVIPSLGDCAHDGVREMDEAAAMLADEPEIARALITHRFPLTEAAEAFRVAADRGSDAIRVVWNRRERQRPVPRGRRRGRPRGRHGGAHRPGRLLVVPADGRRGPSRAP
jgi:2-desacetyl-2-hydroxyethyl bacteriochlorophyllide A dehydrogenase